MNTPETNSNVWEENPWNLDHVNKVRAISFPEDTPNNDTVESYAAELKKIPQLFHDNQVINDNTGRQESFLIILAYRPTT